MASFRDAGSRCNVTGHQVGAWQIAPMRWSHPKPRLDFTFLIASGSKICSMNGSPASPLMAGWPRDFTECCASQGFARLLAVRFQILCDVTSQWQFPWFRETAAILTPSRLASDSTRPDYSKSTTTSLSRWRNEPRKTVNPPDKSEQLRTHDRGKKVVEVGSSAWAESKDQSGLRVNLKGVKDARTSWSLVRLLTTKA